jgi:hypothetical protein
MRDAVINMYLTRLCIATCNYSYEPFRAILTDALYLAVYTVVRTRTRTGMGTDRGLETARGSKQVSYGLYSSRSSHLYLKPNKAQNRETFNRGHHNNLTAVFPRIISNNSSHFIILNILYLEIGSVIRCKLR